MRYPLAIALVLFGFAVTVEKDAPGLKDDMRSTATKRTVRDARGNVLLEEGHQQARP